MNVSSQPNKYDEEAPADTTVEEEMQSNDTKTDTMEEDHEDLDEGRGHP